MSIFLIMIATALLISALWLIRRPGKPLALQLGTLGLLIGGILCFISVYGTTGGLFTAIGAFLTLGLIVALIAGKSKNR